jgi:hypothetical protein
VVDKTLYNAAKVLVLSKDGESLSRAQRKVISSDKLCKVEGKTYEASALMIKLKMK